MKTSKIQWTDTTWNPVTGCTKISAGCKNCYAETMTRRLKAMGQEKYKEGFDKVVCHPEILIDPYGWKKGRKVFVNSMSDLFHDDVPVNFIQSVFRVFQRNPQHTFQVLTKRSDNLWSYDRAAASWPDNLWMGVTIENQDNISRLDDLINTGAKVKFISCEPLLNDLKFSAGSLSMIDWVIVGGESGPKARPMNPDWVRSIRNQCKSAGVPFFFKQWGGRKAAGDLLDGQQYHEWPKINL